MIGAGKKAACIADDLYGLGYNIVGFVSDGTEKKGGVAGDRVIGRLESLPVIVEEKRWMSWLSPWRRWIITV